MKTFGSGESSGPLFAGLEVVTGLREFRCFPLELPDANYEEIDRELVKKRDFTG